MTLDELFHGITRGEYVWGVKRLSANDVGLTNTHQAGVYLPAFFVRKAFGHWLEESSDLNPRIALPYSVVGWEGKPFTPLQVIYYNNKIVADGTRNEFRITNWRQDGRFAFDEQDYNCVFLMAVSIHGPASAVIYVARSASEEERLQEVLGIGPLAPKDFISSTADTSKKPLRFPEQWVKEFPRPQEISDYIARQFAPWTPGCDLDDLVLRRRDLEFRLFDEIEDAYVEPIIQKGFSTKAEFLEYSLSVHNRRKMRSGKSLEYILADLFKQEGVLFTATPVTELHKRPDFLFPSIEAYHCPNFPANKLCMLGVKTTCKDRWRQILTEANRISSPHLFTLDSAITAPQFIEMSSERVQLVMPRPLIRELSWNAEGQITTLAEFVAWRLRDQQGA